MRSQRERGRLDGPAARAGRRRAASSASTPREGAASASWSPAGTRRPASPITSGWLPAAEATTGVPGQHRLGGGQPEALVERRDGDDGGAGEQVAAVGLGTKPSRTMRSRWRRRPAPRRAVGAPAVGAGDHQAAGRGRRRRARRTRRPGGQVLAGLDRAEGQHVAVAAGEARPRAGVAERPRRDAEGHGHDAVGVGAEQRDDLVAHEVGDGVDPCARCAGPGGRGRGTASMSAGAQLGVVQEREVVDGHHPGGPGRRARRSSGRGRRRPARSTARCAGPSKRRQSRPQRAGGHRPAGRGRERPSGSSVGEVARPAPGHGVADEVDVGPARRGGPRPRGRTGRRRCGRRRARWRRRPPAGERQPRVV